MAKWNTEETIILYLLWFFLLLSGGLQRQVAYSIGFLLWGMVWLLWVAMGKRHSPCSYLHVSEFLIKQDFLSINTVTQWEF